MRHRYFELEIKAIAVEHAVVGVATLEATMHSIDLSQASWLIEPNSRMTVHKLESRIIIDSMHLGRHLGISDLMVQAPPQESNDATGGTTESGISDGHGLVLSGTPTSADFDQRVSVSVDVSIAPRTSRPWSSPQPASSPARYRRPNRSGRQTRCGAARLQQPAAEPEAAVRRGPNTVGPGVRTSSSKASPTT
ncbi:hypothetical protein I551_0748 [Mycobacterium ulcerans str. Harvey]|uniref:Uncharacterized protein n=1 Tax=Mycobacterium ulcerans str. Harvey TaxID=1299332 RepID=A0ABN0R639_MYCUL|nr:hypothetical protein I551_0748 [Mycobacterium ulcerans str. Harvey]